MDELVNEFYSTYIAIKNTEAVKELRKYSEGRALVLVYLSQYSEGEVLPSEISKACNLPPARITTFLNELEKSGEIARKLDLEDRRKVRVVLTDKGEAHAKKVVKTIQLAIKKIIKQMGEENASSLIKNMEQVLSAIHSLKENEDE